MNSDEINRILTTGEGELGDHLANWLALKSSRVVFPFEFGLTDLPEESGLIVVRGARQYGKSTWLESELLKSFRNFGVGTTSYLNGDLIANNKELESEIARLVRMFKVTSKIKRIFIDEISAIDGWQQALKILWDAGVTRDILIVTTGSKAADLRHGAEMLPGRKGKLARSTYLFTPISFLNFQNAANSFLQNKDEVLAAYILSGGSPICCSSLLTTGKIPAYMTQLVRDWILGNFTASGRSRSNVIALVETLARVAPNPTSQDKIARESGLASNTSALQYLEHMMDLLCVAQCDNYDVQKRRRNPRKPAKYHFINTLVPVSFGVDGLSSIRDFLQLPPTQRGKWHEWIVAQELWRRSALKGEENPEFMRFWQSSDHEIDFVSKSGELIEVKSGRIDPRDFSWFPLTFPNRDLTVIGDQNCSFGPIASVELFDFLVRG